VPRVLDNTSMEHYVAAASDPKKVLYYDTGHDLNDTQALEDRYEWLVKNIGLRGNPFSHADRPAPARPPTQNPGGELPDWIPVCRPARAS